MKDVIVIDGIARIGGRAAWVTSVYTGAPLRRKWPRERAKAGRRRSCGNGHYRPIRSSCHCAPAVDSLEQAVGSAVFIRRWPRLGSDPEL